MRTIKIIFCASILLTSLLFVWLIEEDNDIKTLVDKSGPYVGANFPKELGFSGEGIKIAIIDTGVDHLHPDLFGFGPDGKVIGGINFVEEGKMPLDSNGHGTEVAGIIAADGNLIGLAPKAKILAYKVSEDGESVASDKIISAIKQAIKDDADVINISLGVNRTNPKLDAAVSEAVKNGIVVITAAGNDGPGNSSIGSPGINKDSITVGATYNNLTSSLVATLQVGEKFYQALPMVGTPALDEPLTREIIFGSYGREGDLQNGFFQNKIILIERGSDVKGELVYFSHKESNAADVGASAIVVYNNEPGVFLGELYHEFNEPDYTPRIPVVSISREDGLGLRQILGNKTIGTLNIFYNPDFVAYFSSRGPVSPFFIKPDLVAPGAFINTTLSNGGYNFTSGTSFAAPHVSAAAGLLLEKNPDLTPLEIKSILVSTTDPVSDPFGNRFPVDVAGAGRLNITKAFEANLIIQPPVLTFSLSEGKESQTRQLAIKEFTEKNQDYKIRFESPDYIEISDNQSEENILVTAKIKEKIFGYFVGRMILDDGELEYNIPIIGQYTEGSLNVIQKDGVLNFEITNPPDWTFAKISATNKDSGKSDTTSAKPNKNSFITVNENGEYWIEAKISNDGSILDAYEVVTVNSAIKNNAIFSGIEIPERPIIILFSIVIIISLVGLKLRK